MFNAIKKFFSAEPELPAAPLPKRNEVCRCGSGRKYKKCCLSKDRPK